MSIALLERIKHLRSNRSVDVETLARAVAANDNLDPADIDETLRAQNIPLEDFTKMVATYDRRIKLQNVLAQAAEVDLRRSELRERVEAENDILEDAVAQHQAATQPLQTEMRSLPQHDINGARGELIRNCPSRELQSQLRKMFHQIEATAQLITDLTNKLQAARTNVGRMFGDAKSDMFPETHAHKSDTKDAAAEIPPLEKQQRDARNRHEELISQLAEIEEQIVHF